MSFQTFIFPAYVRLSSANRKSTRKTSERGQLILAGTLVCAALGIDTDLTLVYQLFALLLSLSIVSRLSLRLNKPSVTPLRLLPTYATVGESFEYQIRVSNVGDHIERDIRIIDCPKVIQPDLVQFHQEKEPYGDTRNAYDRFIGFHRFMWLQRRNTGVTIKPAEVTEIPIRGSVEQTIQALPLRRGMITLESISIMRPDLFGLNYGITNFADIDQLLVLPKRYPVSSRKKLAGGRHFQPGGVNSTWSIGESDEFVALRDYRDGDSLKKIHWASSAKRQKPVVKEYHDEYFVRQALILDNETQDKPLFEEAVSVTASLAMQSNTPDSLIDLILAGKDFRVITAGRGNAHTSQQLEALATIEQSDHSFETLDRGLRGHARLISNAVLVLCSWNEYRRSMVEYLRALNLEIEVFVLTRTTEGLSPESAEGSLPKSAEGSLPGTAEGSLPGIHFIPVDSVGEYLASL